MGSNTEREGWKENFNIARSNFLAETNNVGASVSNEKSGELHAMFAATYEKLKNVFEHMDTRNLNLDNLKVATNTLNTSVNLISSIKEKSQWSDSDVVMLNTLSENCGKMLKGKDKALVVCGGMAWSGTCAVATIPALTAGLTAITILGIPTAAYDLIAGNKPTSPTNLGMRLVEMGLTPSSILRGEIKKVGPQANMKHQLREIKGDLEKLKNTLGSPDVITSETNPLNRKNI